MEECEEIFYKEYLTVNFQEREDIIATLATLLPGCKQEMLDFSTESLEPLWDAFVEYLRKAVDNPFEYEKKYPSFDEDTRRIMAWTAHYVEECVIRNFPGVERGIGHQPFEGYYFEGLPVIKGFVGGQELCAMDFVWTCSLAVLDCLNEKKAKTILPAALQVWREYNREWNDSKGKDPF